jgi:addiction module RelE/StbE family toxin
MTRKVVWSRDALDDLGDLLEYLAADGPDYAFRLIEQIEATGNRLGQHPTGRPGRMPGTYEKSLPRLRYIIAYRVDRPEHDVLTILHVIHAARDWRKGEWPE